MVHLPKSLSYRFKNGPEYLTRETVLWWSYCFWAFGFKKFFFFCSSRVRFSYFSLISSFLTVSASNIPYFPSVLMLSWFGSSIPSFDSLSPRFIMSIAHFSMSNSIPISWMYVLIVCINLQSFSFFRYFYIIHVHKVISLFLWFCKFFAPMFYQSIYLSGIIARTNSSGDSEFSWKVSLYISKCLSSRCQFHPSVFPGIWFGLIFGTFSDNVLSEFAGPFHRQFCRQSMPWQHFSTPFWFLWGCASLYIVGHLFLLFPCSILFVLPQIDCSIQVIDFFFYHSILDFSHPR